MADRDRPDAAPPRAAGAPISEAVADQAAAWLTRLMAEDVGEEERRRWRQWRRSHPDHERAWQHIEGVAARLRGLHPGAAYRALSSTRMVTSRERRRLLGGALGLGLAVGTGWLGTKTGPWRHYAADHRTATGEQREVLLADGSRVTLNTASAIDVRFDERLRLVRLVAGEIHVVTGHAGPPEAERPFVVATAEGTVRALGTRFTVRQLDGRSRVDVFRSAVVVTPAGAPHGRRIARQGEGLSFTRDAVGTAGPAAEGAAAWARGLITADDVRLADFLAELARYRHGVLRCDPAVAELRFSGVFPIGDTDRILAMLPNSLPVRVQRRTPWWVVVDAAPQRAG